MAGRLAILHGWSDNSKSFHPLRDWLDDKGHPAADIWLGDYISLDDDVRVEDVAKRMQVVVRGLIADGVLAPQFDLVVHSTGALVAREWIASFYPDGAGCPVKRLVMLAPANFGSKLAAIGKSMIGRLIKGLGNRLETGTEMLKGLELASPYQWDLVRRDVLAPPGATPVGPFGPGKVLPFVIVGTRAYDSGVQQVVNENGSDGTVRVSAANLNAQGLTIDFTLAPDDPGFIQGWSSRMGAPAPLAVLPERDHSEITRPDQNGQATETAGARLGQLILQALACADTPAAYQAVAQAWGEITDATAALGEFASRDDPGFQALADPIFHGQDRPGPEHFHRYLQLVIMARDDDGRFIGDYFIEFSDPQAKGARSRDRSLVTFHRDVLEAVHTNTSNPAFRCLYIDHTDLMDVFYDASQELAISVTAALPGRNIKYFSAAEAGAQGRIVVHKKDIDDRDTLGPTRFRRHCTHFIEIVVPRRPIDKVFGLSQP